jgi:type II secretory pathway component PulJ
MKLKYKKQKFTLLELLIAVLILVIISTIIAGVFQETLKSYKKGMSYTEISEGLAGSFMVMKSDLNRMLPLGEKKTVLFKEKSFSFIAINETEKAKSYLELIRYKIDYDEKTLYRAVVEYPANSESLDVKDIAFLDGVQDMKFSYIFPKSDDKQNGQKKDATTKSGNGTGQTVTNKENPQKINNKKKDKIKRPAVIKMSGYLVNGKIEEKFTTAFFVSSMKGVKSSGTGTDSDKSSDSSNVKNTQPQQK